MAGPSGRVVLRRRSGAARLLRSWVRIPPGAWMFVCCECSVLSGRGLCGELITRPEESYRLWCVVVCDLETSRMRKPWPVLGRSATEKKKEWMAYISTTPFTFVACAETVLRLYLIVIYITTLFVAAHRTIYCFSVNTRKFNFMSSIIL